MKTLEPNGRFVMVIVNDDSVKRDFPLIVKNELTANPVFANKGGGIAGSCATLASGETLVLSWQSN